MPIPTATWAQRKDKLYVTVDVQDVKDEKCQLENVDGHGKLSFSGTAGKDNQVYTLDLQLFGEINVEESKVSVSARHVFMIIMKTEEGHWPRLTKDSGRHLTHIKCDWNKWVDEDEEDDKPEMDTSGMDFSRFGEGGMGGMPGMGGMGGMGGMDFSALSAMGGMGGMMGGGMGGMGDMASMMGGMGDEEGEDEEDSDNDDDLPDLVK